MPKRGFKYTRVASTRQTRAFNTITRRRVRSLAMAGGQGQRASTRDPEYETRMELAVKDLADGTYRTIKAAAKAHKVSKSPKVLDDLMLHHRLPARRSVTV
jgi:ribosomal protein L15